MSVPQIGPPGSDWIKDTRRFRFAATQRGDDEGLIKLQGVGWVAFEDRLQTLVRSSRWSYGSCGNEDIDHLIPRSLVPEGWPSLQRLVEQHQFLSYLPARVNKVKRLQVVQQWCIADPPQPWDVLLAALDKLVDRIGPQLFQHLVEIRNIVHTAGRVDTNTSNNNSTGRLTLSTNLTEKPHALLALLVLADAGRGGVPLKGLARHVLTMAGGRYTWANKLYSLTDDIKRNRDSVGGLAVIMSDTMRQNTVLFTTSKRGYYFLRDHSRAIFDRIEDPEDAATVSKASLKYDQELAGGIPVTAVTTLQPRVLHILRAATAAAEPELRNLCISSAAAVCGTTPAVSPNTAGAASRIGPHKVSASIHPALLSCLAATWTAAGSLRGGG
ncbi:hypothetical protein WJX73_010552 [Symbiochloris irregularis]|uniref:Uncharacterized protein n=1 Tax=Symbiochloris irregularis TaxID=706552 RepID=A0AAW1NT26_9CHLO